MTEETKEVTFTEYLQSRVASLQAALEDNSRRGLELRGQLLEVQHELEVLSTANPDKEKRKGK